MPSHRTTLSVLVLPAAFASASAQSHKYWTRVAQLAVVLFRRAGQTRGRMAPICRSVGLLSLLIVLLLPVAAAQDGRTQAIAIINAALAASGMNPNAPFPNFIASGQIQYYWTSGVVTGNATVSSAGNKQFRLDAQVSGGTQSWIVNDHDAILRTLRPDTVRIPPRDVTLTKNPLLPVLEMANLLNDDPATVAYLDTVSYGSGTANRILVQKSVTVDSDTTLMSKIYYVDVASSLVVETDELMSTSDGGLSKVTRQLQYSNYQNESGIYLATQVVESVAGQNTWNLGISAYNLGAYVPQSTFSF